jgi:hypothetical protein
MPDFPIYYINFYINYLKLNNNIINPILKRSKREYNI